MCLFIQIKICNITSDAFAVYVDLCILPLHIQLCQFNFREEYPLA